MEKLLCFPTAVDHDPAIDAWLAAQRPDFQPLLRVNFERMRAAGPGLRELMHDGFPTACVGEAAFAYVAAFRDHVNVGFLLGALLPDPKGLLQGTGKRGRHVKLWPDRPVDDAALAALIQAAYADMRGRVS